MSLSVALPELTIRLVGTYRSSDLDRLLHDLASLAVIDGLAVLTIDLGSVTWLSAPVAAVFVAAITEVMARGAVAPGSRIVLPDDAAGRRRLEDLGVLVLLSDLSPDERWDELAAGGSCRCQLFSGAEDPSAPARSLSLAIAEACDTESFAQDVIWYTLSEIAQNVVDHAQALGGAVGIAEITMARAEIEVAIADFGIGIRPSLIRNPAHESISEIEALRVAVSAGGSSRTAPPEPVGLGLYFTQLILQDNGGTLAIRSGGAELVTGSFWTESSALEQMHGTLVTLRFRTDKPVRLESILPTL